MNEMAAAVEAVGTGASPVTVVDEEIRTPWGPVTARFAAVPPPQAQPRSWMWLSVLSAVIAVGALVFAMLPDGADPVPQVIVQAPAVAGPPADGEAVPKPVVLPAEVPKVNFTITTAGVDAQILDARDEGIYGMTNDPNGVMVQKADTPIELILRAKGYEDHRFTIIPSQDKRFDKAMVAVKANTPSKPKPRDRDRDPKPAKQDTPVKPEVKPAEPADDSGGGSDLKNPFGKK
jgi:serine/threonine-protein kinase